MLFYSYFKTLVGKKVTRDTAALLCMLFRTVFTGVMEAVFVMPPDIAPLCCRPRMQVTVELKNDLAISGTLHSVDQYLNIKLDITQVC